MGKIIEDDVSLQKLLLVTLFDLSDVEVTGDFDCSNNYLTNLEGSPHTVGGKFNCNKNNLTSLKGGPRIVNGDFDCYNNNLTSLAGIPKIVGNNAIVGMTFDGNAYDGNFNISKKLKDKFPEEYIRSLCTISGIVNYV